MAHAAAWRLWSAFSQRFGTTPPLPEKRPGVKRVWLQAVSVGELLAVAPLIDAWQDVPEIEIYLTTTTSTGYALAETRYLKTGKVQALAYFPMDFWPFSARAWWAINPDGVVLMEGERWPEHLHQAGRRGVPAVTINARLSDRSFRRMRRLGPLAGLLTRGLTRVLAASEGDAERFARFGVPPERIGVTGNLKLDVALPDVSAEAQLRYRDELGLGDARVLLGASTWPGEEAALLEAWRSLGGVAAGWRLLLVPRHAERRAELAAWLASEAVSHHFRSRGAAAGEVAVAVADTTGELARLLVLGDIVFVGKTLPPHTEGQTPVEAAARGKPLVLGPGTANFRQITAELVAAGAARRVADAAELARCVGELAADRGALQSASEAGLGWHAANRGAADRTREALAEVFGAGQGAWPEGLVRRSQLG